MNRPRLGSLLQLRHAALDEAQHRLVTCLQAETQAEKAAVEAERHIAQEMAAVEAVTASDAAVEAFAVWLPQARRRAIAARSAAEQMQAESARMRAAVAACQNAVEAAEAWQQQQFAAPEAENVTVDQTVGDRSATASSK